MAPLCYEISTASFSRPAAPALGNGPAVMQPALREALAVSPIGYYRVGGAVDGINRLVSYRRCRMCITSHSTR